MQGKRAPASGESPRNKTSACCWVLEKRNQLIRVLPLPPSSGEERAGQTSTDRRSLHLAEENFQNAGVHEGNCWGFETWESTVEENGQDRVSRRRCPLQEIQGGSRKEGQ